MHGLIVGKQNLKTDALPDPALPVMTTPGHPRGQLLRDTAQHCVCRILAQQRGCTANMVIVTMTDDQHIQASNPRMTQKRYNDRTSGIEGLAERRTGIEDECMLLR